MLNNIHLLQQSSVIFNLLSRAESTIFIATTINNQHFLQISAPLCKSEKKNVNQSLHPPTHLTTQWHQLPPSLAPFLINPNPVINLISQSRSTLSGNFNNHLSITNNCNTNSSYLNLIMSPIADFFNYH